MVCGKLLDPLEVLPDGRHCIWRYGRSAIQAFNPDSNHIVYQTSSNLVDWSPGIVLRSSILFLAEASAADPMIRNDATPVMARQKGVLH